MPCRTLSRTISPSRGGLSGEVFKPGLHKLQDRLELANHRQINPVLRAYLGVIPLGGELQPLALLDPGLNFIPEGLPGGRVGQLGNLGVGLLGLGLLRFRLSGRVGGKLVGLRNEGIGTYGWPPIGFGGTTAASPEP